MSGAFTVSHRSSRDLPAGIGFGLATVFVAVVGSVVNNRSMDWYDGLEQPSFTPPGAVFGIVWTVLYVMIAIAGFLAWRAADSIRPTAAWVVQMALNLGWTVVFFGLRAPEAALVVIGLLLVAVVVDLRESGRVSRAAGLLLVPYLLWCGFATALNIGFLALN